jgi:antitoxin HicB
MWSDEDESYVATIPEFPGLSAFGETPGEAVEEAKIAADGFIKVFKEDGRLLPEPAVLSPYSGQLRIRIPKTLHASLTAEAAKECVSLNTYMVNLLSERNAFAKVRKEMALNKPLIIDMSNVRELPRSSAINVDGSITSWPTFQNIMQLTQDGERR